MAEEKKLGPNVTYVGAGEDDKAAVTMAGVRFEPGKSVNLEDRLGKSGAASMLQKLSKNRYFKVDGGVDHEAEAKKREEMQAKEYEDAVKSAEDQRKQAQGAQQDRQQQGGLPQPPSDWEGPDEAHLERQPTSRKGK